MREASGVWCKVGPKSCDVEETAPQAATPAQAPTAGHTERAHAFIRPHFRTRTAGLQSSGHKERAGESNVWLQSSVQDCDLRRRKTCCCARVRGLGVSC